MQQTIHEIHQAKIQEYRSELVSELWNGNVPERIIELARKSETSFAAAEKLRQEIESAKGNMELANNFPNLDKCRLDAQAAYDQAVKKGEKEIEVIRDRVAATRRKSEEANLACHRSHYVVTNFVLMANRGEMPESMIPGVVRARLDQDERSVKRSQLGDTKRELDKKAFELDRDVKDLSRGMNIRQIAQYDPISPKRLRDEISKRKSKLQDLRGEIVEVETKLARLN